MDAFIQVLEMTAGHWHVSYVYYHELVDMYTTASDFNKITMIDREHVYVRFMGTASRYPFIRTLVREEFIERLNGMARILNIRIYLVKFESNGAYYDAGRDMGFLPPVLSPINMHSMDPIVRSIIEFFKIEG